MKVENAISKPELSNIHGGNEFTMKATAKSFQILSSGLYSNKIRAIIRELSCNAYDSHVEAGKKDVPFDCHLPSKLNPFFYIRDYGTGLSHDDAMSMYSTYFESTKTESNDYVGALGLGSKSPFCYVYNFTVTSIYENVKRIYTVFINQSGIPKISPVSSIETDECNGFEVKLPLASVDDVYSFIQEAEYVYQYFPVKPNIFNQRISINDYSSNCEKVFDDVYVKSKGYRHSVAVQGNIAYPISLPDHKDYEVYKRFLNYVNVVLLFDIGELDVAASREELSYIPSTSANICKKLDKLIAKFSLEIENIDKDATLSNWTKAATFLEILNKGYYRVLIEKYIKENDVPYITCNFHGLQSYPTLPDDIDPDEINIRSFSRRGDSSVKVKYKSSEFRPSNSVMFVVNRKSKSMPMTKMKHFAQVDLAKNEKYSGYQAVYMVTIDADDRSEKLDKFMKALGNPPVFDFDDLEISYKKPESKSVVLKASSSFYDSAYMKTHLDKIPDTTKCIYLPVKGYKVTEGHFAGVTLYDVVREIKSKSSLYLSVYGVRQANIDEVKEKDNWVNLYDYLEEWISTVSVDDIENRFFNRQASNSIDLHYKVSQFVTQKIGTTHPLSSVLSISGNRNSTKIVISKDKFDSTYNISDIEMIYRFIGKKEMIDKIRDTAYNKLNELVKNYPLLTMIKDDRFSESQCKMIVDYVKTIDSTKETV